MTSTMTVTIIQGLWKESSKEKNYYYESASGHRAVKGKQQEIFFIVNVLVATGLWKEGSNTKIYCEGPYGHVALW
jgi:hypothetical protein